MNGYFSHPLLTGQVVVATAPIEELFVYVKRIVFLGGIGLCSTAAPGVGKTYAATYIANQLQVQNCGTGVIFYSKPYRRSPSESHLLRTLLVSFNHPVVEGPTPVLRKRLVNAVRDYVRRQALLVVVLVIDNAEEILEGDYDVLDELINNLAQENVRLVPLLFGQRRQLNANILLLQSRGRRDLVEKFMGMTTPLRGYRNLNDFEIILTAMDEKTWPLGSSCCWTQYFFPNAYAHGLRMNKEASTVFNILASLAEEAQALPEFPARPVFLVLRALALLGNTFDSPSSRLPTRAWSQAINDARFKDKIIPSDIPCIPNATSG
jgi:hypothetical protein